MSDCFTGKKLETFERVPIFGNGMTCVFPRITFALVLSAEANYFDLLLENGSPIFVKCENQFLALQITNLLEDEESVWVKLFDLTHNPIREADYCILEISEEKKFHSKERLINFILDVVEGCDLEELQKEKSLQETI